MKSEIQNCLTWLTNKTTELYLYPWSDNFKMKELQSSMTMFYKELEKHMDLTNITVEEAKELRFQKWDEEYPDLWLFPLWLVPIIPDGFEVINLSGEKELFNKETHDNDTRFGCVAYGINIKK